MKRQKLNFKGLENNFLDSAEAVFSNEDLLSEILLRVPARSLVRFKCVSKHWLGLISGQNFCYNHSSQNRESISALYFYVGSYRPDGLKSISLCGHRNLPSMSFLKGFKGREVVSVRHTLNGLTLGSYGWPGKFIVYNLTTQKYRIITEREDIESEIMVCCLAYDPAVSPYYKIVFFAKNCFGSYHIDIYSSEKSSWTRLHDLKLSGICMASRAFFNGLVHCVSSNYYFRFEVDKQKLTKTLLPSEPRIPERGYINIFGECGGNLSSEPSFKPIAEAFPEKEFKFYLLTLLKGSHKGDIIPVIFIKEK